MSNNHLAVDPTEMLLKLYNADGSIFVWVTFAIKESDHLRGIQPRE